MVSLMCRIKSSSFDSMIFEIWVEDNDGRYCGSFSRVIRVLLIWISMPVMALIASAYELVLAKSVLTNVLSKSNTKYFFSFPIFLLALDASVKHLKTNRPNTKRNVDTLIHIPGVWPNPHTQTWNAHAIHADIRYCHLSMISLAAKLWNAFRTATNAMIIIMFLFTTLLLLFVYF